MARSPRFARTCEGPPGASDWSPPWTTKQRPVHTVSHAQILKGIRIPSIHFIQFIQFVRFVRFIRFIRVHSQTSQSPSPWSLESESTTSRVQKLDTPRAKCNQHSRQEQQEQHRTTCYCRIQNFVHMARTFRTMSWAWAFHTWNVSSRKWIQDSSGMSHMSLCHQPSSTAAAQKLFTMFNVCSLYHLVIAYNCPALTRQSCFVLGLCGKCTSLEPHPFQCLLLAPNRAWFWTSAIKKRCKTFQSWMCLCKRQCSKNLPRIWMVIMEKPMGPQMSTETTTLVFLFCWRNFGSATRVYCLCTSSRSSNSFFRDWSSGVLFRRHMSCKWIDGQIHKK